MKFLAWVSIRRFNYIDLCVFSLATHAVLRGNLLVGITIFIMGSVLSVIIETYSK
jgi:hypothetical protein